MGVDLGKLVPRHSIKLKELKGKKIAVDTYIELYQFLRTLPSLTDSKGRVTTHLVGLFFRTTHLLSLGIKPCFVFDGPFPEIKKHRRITSDIPLPRTSSTLSAGMVQAAKTMLKLLGLPVIQAPSEGEAQAAHMCRRRDVWAVASQDYDSLLYGAPRMLKNLTLAKTRKLPKGGHVLIGTYLIDLKETLKELNITHDQLTALSMLIGTDFNPGVHGIGPKKGLKLVQTQKNLNRLFKTVGWNYAYDWEEVFDCIKTLPVTNKYKLQWKKINEEAVVKFLVHERDFNETRVRNALAKIGG